MGCDGWTRGFVEATGLPPNSFVSVEFGGGVQGGQADGTGAAQIAIGGQGYEAGDTLAYNVISDGETVASDTVEIDDLCGATGTFSVTRSCEFPDVLDVAVNLVDAPANESVRLTLLTDNGEGFYFSQEGYKGNPGVDGMFRTGAGGVFSGTVTVSPGKDTSFIDADPAAFNAQLLLLAPDYGHARLLPDRTLAVPACKAGVPTDPVPTDPVPTDPVPTDPVPTDPVPTDPEPVEPPAVLAPATDYPAGAGSATVAQGGVQTVTVPGFLPGEPIQVTLVSVPVDLGAHEADANGVVTLTFTLPAGVEPGSHRVELVGQTSGRTVNVQFEVAAAAGLVQTTFVPAAPQSQLASTGADVLPLMGLAGLALLAGAGLLAGATRHTARR
jgi:hypothetical protein